MVFIMLIMEAIVIILCAIKADSKGRSVGGWIVGGVFLGWIAVIILCFLPDAYVQGRTNGRSIYNVSPPQEIKIKRVGQYKCENCGELIDTAQCPWCGKRKN